MIRYPLSEAGFIASMVAIPVVGLFVLCFNAYRMGKFSRRNRNRRTWFLGCGLLTLAVAGYLVWYLTGV